MSGRNTFIESVEVAPLEGEVMHFASSSGGEVLRFSCSRSTAVALAREIVREAQDADRRDGSRVLYFPMAETG